jgi:predicted SnoaL-like aldol condensation-catalyzing enzyme
MPAPLDADRDVFVLDRYYTESLIQHNPRFLDVTDGLRARVTANMNLHHQTGMVAADGDIVMVHGRYEGLGPKPMVGVDIYRVKDGRIAKHWDVLEEEVSQTASGHPVFTVPGQDGAPGCLRSWRLPEAAGPHQHRLAGPRSLRRAVLALQHRHQHVPGRASRSGGHPK